MKKTITYQIAVVLLLGIAGIFWGTKEAYLTLLGLLFLLYSLAVNEQKRSILYSWLALPVAAAYLMFRLPRFSSIPNHVFIATGILIFILLAAYLVGFFLSKCRKEVVRVAMLSVASIILCLLGNLISRPMSFMLTGVVFLVAPYIAYRYISQNKYVPLILIAPMIILNLEVLLSGYLYNFPLALIYFFSTGIYYLALLLRKKRILQVALISLYAVFLAFGWCSGYKSYRQWVSVQESKLPNSASAKYLFYDTVGQAVNQDEHQNKIVVFDFWTTSCAVCFRKFPEFDRVYQKYRHRGDVAFYAVNLPTKRDTKESIMKVAATHINYSFPILLAAKDSDYWTQFKIRGVPHLMILDKNGKVTYSGFANYEKRVAYNIENIIDKLLSEQGS